MLGLAVVAGRTDEVGELLGREEVLRSETHCPVARVARQSHLWQNGQVA